MIVSTKAFALLAVAAPLFSSVLTLPAPERDATDVPRSLTNLVPRLPPIRPDPDPVPPGHGDGDPNGGHPSGDPGSSDGGGEPGSTNVSPELIGDSSGDNKQTGLDPDGVAYVKTWGDRIRDKIPVEERIPAFFSDFGDEGDAANFIHDQLDGKGFVFDQVFDPLKDKDLLNAQPLYVNNYWLAIYRGSRACAQENLGSEVFVSMGKTEDGTKINIFDDIALKSGDNIRPGVGQIWYQVEIPTLMRNPNTQKITAVYKNDDGSWERETQWDANDQSKPRDYRPLIPLDSVDHVDPVPGSTAPPPPRAMA